MYNIDLTYIFPVNVKELTDFEDNERSDEEQSSDENKNQEIDSDNVKNESSKKRAAADSPKRPIKKKPNKETDKNDKVCECCNPWNSSKIHAHS